MKGTTCTLRNEQAWALLTESMCATAPATMSSENDGDAPSQKMHCMKRGVGARLGTKSLLSAGASCNSDMHKCMACLSMAARSFC